MKRAMTLILVLVLCLTLCACGKSEAVKNVEAMIEAANSPEALGEALAAYNALTEEEAEKVKNADALNDALEQRLMGNWVWEPSYYNDIEDMYDEVYMTLGEDMRAEGEYTNGEWRVEDGQIKINNGEYDSVYYIFWEDGKLKVGSMNRKMIRTEDYNALLDAMFVTVEVTPENIADYCKCTIYTQIVEDDFGVVTGDTRTYAILESTVYDEGLYYVEGSDDLAIELLIPEHKREYHSDGRVRNYTEEADTYVVKRVPYNTHGASLGNKSVENGYEYIHDITADQITFGRVTGKITYIRAEYVEAVKQSDSGSSRVLVLKDGVEVYAGSWSEDLEF